MLQPGSPKKDVDTAVFICHIQFCHAWVIETVLIKNYEFSENYDFQKSTTLFHFPWKLILQRAFKTIKNIST